MDGSDEHEDVKLYCRVTGAEIPHDKYTRRGHFIGCCVGDCMPRDIADVNENNMGELQSQWAPNEGAPQGKWAQMKTNVLRILAALVRTIGRTKMIIMT